MASSTRNCIGMEEGADSGWNEEYAIQELAKIVVDVFLQERDGG